ncbi:SDR family oxidoreductase [Pseudomonas sp. R2.Fl]|nr:SDR family oxidoreductase [Pseudomonas sp. R2.Fl]
MTKLAVVTGGSSGIGRELVQAFARAGYRVAFSHFNDKAGADVVEVQVAAAGGRACGFDADAGDGEAVERFFDAVADWGGTAPDVLVNNAGIQTWSSLLDLSEEAWNRVIRTNLTGTFLTTKAAARRMVDAGKAGSIINLGSGCNKLAFPRLVDYTASKGGIEQFTKVAASELGPRGIRVNCVAPGAILTARTLEEAPDYEETWSKLTPLRRVGRPADIAGVVLFLASEAAAFVSGQTIWVDGGLFSQAPWPYPT